jgi:hypothetical protein
MIGFIIGLIVGFAICCLFTYVGIKNRDDEIDLLNKKIDKYEQRLYYSEEFVKKD